MSELNREEIMHLLRRHVATFAGMLQEQNSLPKNMLAGGLNRINELFALLKDSKPNSYEGGE